MCHRRRPSQIKRLFFVTRLADISGRAAGVPLVQDRLTQSGLDGPQRGNGPDGCSVFSILKRSGRRTALQEQIINLRETGIPPIQNGNNIRVFTRGRYQSKNVACLDAKTIRDKNVKGGE